MARWGMTIDLDLCIGCEACTVACKANNFTPSGVSWLRIVKDEAGQFPNVTRLPFPLQCQQCAKAPCVDVCPTGATYVRDDGIVAVNYDKCVGCQYCVLACPYGARTFVEDLAPYYPAGKTEFELFAGLLGGEPDAATGLPGRHQAGVVEKCVFCVQKIESGIAAGLTPGVDADATPACVVTCIAGARVFGDLDDPDSAVSRKASSSGAFRFHEEYGTEPNIYYLPARQLA
ncbi:MAG: 4Fe-4S dicluster domain-containing protein [Propionibacteriaceae bacterium]|nr:4Fe-4S dicluster domain-containing protein [Propionibacteriaceae bacterium]